MSRSLVEEILATLDLIAGLLAWSNGIQWLAWVLFVKTVLDTLCAIKYALREVAEEHVAKQDAD